MAPASLVDRYFVAKAYDGRVIDRPIDPERPDNLHDPAPGDPGARGGFAARGSSVQWRLARLAQWAITAAAAGLAARLKARR
jgi:hypothetical protein